MDSRRHARFLRYHRRGHGRQQRNRSGDGARPGRSGARTVLACRDPGRGRRALDAVRRAAPDLDLRLVGLDLADLSSVAEAAGHIAEETDGNLDLLVNNAGVMALPLMRTADGFEMQFGTNHLGHFALTHHLLPLLGVRGMSRVVTVSSLAHRIGRIDFGNLNAERRYDKWRVYGQSKLANLLFTAELQRRADAAGKQVLALAAHPGLSATELGQAGPRLAGSTWAARLERATRVYTQPASAGALPTLYAATLPTAPGGSYYGPRLLGETRGGPAPARLSARAQDMTTALALWDESARLTGTATDAIGTRHRPLHSPAGARVNSGGGVSRVSPCRRHLLCNQLHSNDRGMALEHAILVSLLESRAPAMSSPGGSSGPSGTSGPPRTSRSTASSSAWRATAARRPRRPAASAGRTRRSTPSPVPAAPRSPAGCTNRSNPRASATISR